MNNNEEMTVPEKLYHYTSKEGFLGIIENKMLWASEILYMNDGKETYVAFEIFKELLKEDKNTDIKKKIDCLDEEFQNLLFKEFRGFETYVISFSEKKDDLNMWRAYGDDGFGICIEFDSCNLLEALRKNQEKIKLTFEKCIYDKQEQKDKIQALLDSEKGSNSFNIGRLSENCLNFLLTLRMGVSRMNKSGG